jgi:hypothetical protein
MATAPKQQELELAQDLDRLMLQLRKSARSEQPATAAPAPSVAGNTSPMMVGSAAMSVTVRALSAVLSNQTEVQVIAGADQDHVISRTEQHGGRFDVDLNLSWSDLDEYEATAVKRLVITHLRSLLTAARQENADERIKQLIKAIAPTDPLAEIQLKVAESTASLRREFLEEVPVLGSAEIHANAGFPGANPSQTVHRWRKQGKIFAVTHGGRDVYPAFQFGQDGRPLPIIAEVLDILKRDAERTDWDNALWFAGETGWLDGKSPLDCLQSDPAGIKRAAEQEVVDEH